MANTWKISGTATLGIDNSSIQGNLTQTVTLNGVNGAWQSLNVSTASWTPLNDTSSLSDFRYGYFSNDLQATSSIITIATGSAGQNPLATLQADDVFLLPGSGSVIPLYAKVTGGTGATGVLQFILTES